MKKQVLIFTALALSAGTMAFGQALPGSATRGTGATCADDALHPIAGKTYVYQAAATPAGGTFLFWATKDETFISTTGATTTTNIATKLNSPTTTPVGTDLTATSANYAVAGASDQVSITWSDAVLSGTTPVTDPTFVAVYYTAPAAGCADNFNAWEIEPIPAFIVDIRNIADATNAISAYDATISECVDQVRGAVYNAGTIEFDFGADTLYYEVVAANFTVSWTPTMSVTGMTAEETTDITWTYDAPATWGGGTVWNASTTTVATNETNTSAGVSIYVRVIITHNTSELLADRAYNLIVDGVNSVAEWDIENNTTVNPGPLCNPGTLNDNMDVAIQTLRLRPTLTPVAPTPFLPNNKTN